MGHPVYQYCHIIILSLLASIFKYSGPDKYFGGRSLYISHFCYVGKFVNNFGVICCIRRKFNNCFLIDQQSNGSVCCSIAGFLTDCNWSSVSTSIIRDIIMSLRCSLSFVLCSSAPRCLALFWWMDALMNSGT